jgi:hypothetical protein
MTTPLIHIELSQWIRQQLQTAIHLEANMVELAVNICGTENPLDLFNDVQSSEAATFFDFVFQPTADQHHAYEIQFGHLQLPTDTLSNVIDVLSAPPLTVQIHFPGQPGPFVLQLTEDLLSTFVQRLNISWSPPERLHQILECQLKPHQRPLIRAQLRRTRIAWHPRQLELLELFLARFPMTSSRFQPCFTFVLQLSTEIDHQEEILELLTAKKRFYQHALTRAETFERRLNAGNMEILMLQGERAAYGHPEQWRTQMDDIDQICQLLFGTIPHVAPPISQHFNVQTTPAGVDLNTLRRILE